MEHQLAEKRQIVRTEYITSETVLNGNCVTAAAGWNIDLWRSFELLTNSEILLFVDVVRRPVNHLRRRLSIVRVPINETSQSPESRGDWSLMLKFYRFDLLRICCTITVQQVCNKSITYRTNGAWAHNWMQIWLTTNNIRTNIKPRSHYANWTGLSYGPCFYRYFLFPLKMENEKCIHFPFCSGNWKLDIMKIRNDIASKTTRCQLTATEGTVGLDGRHRESWWCMNSIATVHRLFINVFLDCYLWRCRQGIHLTRYSIIYIRYSTVYSWL